MGDAFLGEIRMFAGNYAPVGWAFCDGQTLSVQQYQALFTLLGTTFGGDGDTTFRVPNLQGRVVMGVGNGHDFAEMDGTETATVTSVSQLPAHTHVPAASNIRVNGGLASPQGNVWSLTPRGPYSVSPSGGVQMNAETVSAVGSTTPAAHDNVMPYLPLNYIICVSGGDYPPRPS